MVTRRDGPPRAGLADLPDEARTAQILLAGPFNGPDDRRLLRAVTALASVIGISPDAIAIIRVADKEAQLDLPFQALLRLQNRLKANDARLRMLRTGLITLEIGFGRREEWMLQKGRFSLRPPQPAPARPPQPIRIHIFQPLLVAALVGCVAYPAAELAQVFWPTVGRLFLTLAPMVSAVESGYSYQLLRHRRLFASEIKFRSIELLFLLLLIKAATYIGQRPADILQDIRAWPHDPRTIANAEALLATVLCLVAWHTTTVVMNDLRRLGEPPEKSRYYVSPLDNLAGHFFWGGGVLLLLVGLNSIGRIGSQWTDFRWPWALLARLRQSASPDMALVLLIYHMLGLLLLGQVRLALLRKQWQAQSLTVDETLERRWLMAGLALVAISLLVAFLLPTGYTVGFLRIFTIALAWISQALVYLGSLLFFLFALLLAPLLALLFGSGRFTTPAGGAPRFQPPVEPQIAAGPPPEWLMLVRTLLFWGLVAAVVLYVVIAYLRDHPELLAWLADWRPLASLRRLWAAIRCFWRRWETAFRQRLGTRDRRVPDRPSGAPRPFRFLRLSALSPRERILYYYWSLLKRAAQLGLPRRPPQTPREYRASLETRLPEVEDEMGELTEAFIEARYSRHPVGLANAQAARQDWQQVKGSLRRLKRGQSPAEQSDRDHR